MMPDLPAKPTNASDSEWAAAKGHAAMVWRYVQHECQGMTRKAMLEAFVDGFDGVIAAIRSYDQPDQSTTRFAIHARHQICIAVWGVDAAGREPKLTPPLGQATTPTVETADPPTIAAATPEPEPVVDAEPEPVESPEPDDDSAPLAEVTELPTKSASLADIVADVAPEADPDEAATEIVASLLPADRDRLFAALLAKFITDLRPRTRKPADRTCGLPDRDRESRPDARGEIAKSSFALPDGRLVRWVDATVADHVARAEWCEAKASTLRGEADRHWDAARRITDAGVSCLGDLDSDAVAG